ncbi:MAG TPA: DUF4199 domain-containing protein [Bacteroidales bacterium]|nr:DUF4199 domain-containing protein [Bacteroidales bacterium]
METESEIGIENHPVNNTKELFRNALMYGLMLGGVMILIDLLMYTFDLSGLGIFVGLLVTLLTIVIYFVFFIRGGRSFRDKFNNGHINYGIAFLFCVIMAIVSTLILTLYYYLFYNFFDPERAINEGQRAMEMIAQNDNIPDEQKEEIMQSLLDKAETNNIVVRSLISNSIFSVFVGAISALFVRKKEKINDVIL